MNRNSLPTVSVGALGGTIAMTAAPGGGLTPTLNADDLVAMLGAERAADLRTASLATVPSASLRLSDLAGALDWARAEIAAGSAGVVLTQGTDTLEEVAFWLDLFWELDAPLVITGAMRNPAQPGADGPGNLAAAVAIAHTDSSRGRGVLVVMGDVIHRAERVRKAHSSRPDAFDSEPIEGLMVEGSPVFHNPPWRREALAQPPVDCTSAGIHVVEQTLSDDGDHLRLLGSTGPRAIIISATGVGHVSTGSAEAISELIDAGVPVVVAGRAGRGTTFDNSYGYVGAERDLRERGVIMAGWLSARAARLLTVALLATGADDDALRSAFEIRAGRW